MAEAQTDTRPIAVRVAEIGYQFWNSQFLLTATRLGVADILADGPKTPAEIAGRAGAQPLMVKRLLRALAPLGFFAIDDDGRYHQTPMSDALRADHPHSMRAAVLFWVDEWNWRCAGALEHGVRTGEFTFNYLFGRPYFEVLSEHPEKEKIFADAMTGMSLGLMDSIAKAYPFGDFDTVVDVGGSNGNLIATILRHYPKTKGVLFDLPEVTERARSAGYLDAPEVVGRVSVAAGSALESVVSGHDCYIIKNVIHDWDDDQSVTILGNIRKAMNDGGKLLVAEALIQPGNAPDPWKQLDLALFSGGGMERTEEEYRILLERAGLRLERKFPAQGGLWLLETVKA